MTRILPRLPSLKALRAFEVVSRHLHVIKAAQELSVTPSAVSHLIRNLEMELNVTLIEKAGRNIKLTQAGLEFAPRVQHVFQSLSHSVNEIREKNNPEILTVSLRPYFAVKWLSPRLSRFWAQHPDIELRLIHTNKIIDFKTKRVDLAIEWSKGDRTESIQTKLIEGELTPVFSAHLQGAQNIKNASDLFDFTLLRETDYDSWKDWFEAANIDYKKPKHTHFIDDSNVRYQAAIDGQGIELSCRSLIQDDISSGSLLSPFEQSISHFSYYLVEPPNPQASPACEKFILWLKQEALPSVSDP